MSFFSMLITFVVIVAGAAIGLQIMAARSRKSMRDAASDWMTENGFREYKVMFGPGDALAIDYERRRIAFQASGKRAIISFADLVSVEVSENGATVSKANRASQLAGAAIGAAAFGGVGAIVGGLSGSSTTKEKVSTITINLITKDISTPYVEILAFQQQPTEKGSFVYSQLTKDIMPWYGRLRAVLEES